MKTLAKTISALALAATIVPSLLLFFGILSPGFVTAAALLGTVAWFVATPVWMGRELPVDAGEVEI